MLPLGAFVRGTACGGHHCLSWTQEVVPGTAADRAGLRGTRRVVIVTRALNRKRPGEIVELTIYRGGRQQTVRVTLGEMPEERY